MDLSQRLILYILIVNVGYMMYSLAQRGVAVYRGYLLQLSLIVSYMLLMVGWGENGTLAIVVSAGLIFLVVVIPLLLQKHIEALIAEQRFGELENPARIKAYLAWSELNLHLYRLAQATREFDEAPAEAEVAVRRLLGRGEPYDGMTRMFLAMIHFNQRRFEALLEILHVPNRPLDDYSVEELLYLVRGYLETDRFEEATNAQFALERRAIAEANRANLANLQVSRLLFFAFLGWEEDLQRLLAAQPEGIDQLPDALRDFWIGVAAFQAGRFPDGRLRMEQALTKLSAPESNLPDHWIDWGRRRLRELHERESEFATTVLPRLQTLREKHLVEFRRLTETTPEAVDVAPQAQSGTTILLFTIGLTFFMSRFLADPNDLIDLLAMGANNGFLVRQGEWFRLVSSLFIHLGWVHLLMNAFALRYFGPPVETVTGLPLFLGVYFVSGLCGSFATVQHLPGMSVGASGAVLGLLGAAIVFDFGAKYLPNDGPQRVLRPGGHFTTLVFILAINLVIGLLEKGIDNSAHFGGLIGGAVSALILLPLLSRPRLKGLAVVVSIIFTVGLCGAALWGFTRPRQALPYPTAPASYHQASVASGAWTVELPGGWSIDTASASEDAFRVVIHGTFGERVDLLPAHSSMDRDGLIKAYAEGRTKAVMNQEEINLRSVSDPASTTIGPWSCWRMLWRLEYADRRMVQRDYFCFQPGQSILVQTMLPTDRDRVYDPLIHRLIASIRYKGDSEDDADPDDLAR